MGPSLPVAEENRGVCFWVWVFFKPFRGNPPPWPAPPGGGDAGSALPARASRHLGGCPRRPRSPLGGAQRAKQARRRLRLSVWGSRARLHCARAPRAARPCLAPPRPRLASPRRGGPRLEGLCAWRRAPCVCLAGSPVGRRLPPRLPALPAWHLRVSPPQAAGRRPPLPPLPPAAARSLVPPPRPRRLGRTPHLWEFLRF